MPEALSGLFDVKTLLLLAVLGGGSNVAQYFGLAAPAQDDARQGLELVSEAQGAALDAQKRVAELMDLLSDCQDDLAICEGDE